MAKKQEDRGAANRLDATAEQPAEKPGVLGQVKKLATVLTSDRHLNGMARLGLSELGRALHPAGTGIQPIEITGIAGNPTQSEIAAVGQQEPEATVHGKPEDKSMSQANEPAVEPTAQQAAQARVEAKMAEVFTPQPEQEQSQSQQQEQGPSITD